MILPNPGGPVGREAWPQSEYENVIKQCRARLALVWHFEPVLEVGGLAAGYAESSGGQITNSRGEDMLPRVSGGLTVWRGIENQLSPWIGGLEGSIRHYNSISGIQMPTRS